MSFQVHAQFFRSFRGQQLVSNSPLKSFVWWLLFLFHLEFNYKKHSNRLYSCQCDISSIFFKKKLYGSEFKFKKHSNRLYRGQCNISSILFKKKLYGPEFKFKKHSNRLYCGQCDISSILFKKKLYASFQVQMPKVYRATTSKQFTFYHSVSRNSWYRFYQPRKDKRLTQPWSHTVALKTGPLDWESSALTNRPVFVFLLPIFNESKI